MAKTAFSIRLEPEYIKALDDTAGESNKTRSQLAASLVKDVLDDDAEVHGKPRHQR